MVVGTCPTNSSHEAFWGTSRGDLSQKFKPVWIRGTSRRDQSWSMWLDFEAKKWPVHAMGLVLPTCSHYYGTCPRDLLQGLVAGTRHLVCPDLNTMVIWNVTDTDRLPVKTCYLLLLKLEVLIFLFQWFGEESSTKSKKWNAWRTDKFRSFVSTKLRF